MGRFPILDPRARRAFVKKNWRFLDTVKKNLAERGIEKSTATISRTWAGLYRRPNRDVVEELEAEYTRLTIGDDAVVTRERSQSPPRPSQVISGSAFQAKPADVQPATVPASTPIVPTRENPAGAVDGLSTPSATEMRYRTQIEEREEWLRKRRKKREDDEAWLRARQVERARGEAWMEDRLRLQQDLDDRGLRQQREPAGPGLRPEEGRAGTTSLDFLLTLHEVAQILAISDSTAKNILNNEPDVLNLVGPTGKRAITRVPVKVLQRIIMRGSIPWPTRREYGGG